jgi:hypothetical protein
MRFTSCGLLANNTADKIVAVCGGLIACALAMLAVQLFALDVRLPFILVDDVCFGRRVEAIEWVFAAEAGVAMATILLLPRRPQFATRLGLCWSGAMFAESLIDVGTFGADPRLVAEELAFVAIYGCLLVLFFALWSRTHRQTAASPNANGPAGASASDRAAEPESSVTTSLPLSSCGPVRTLPPAPAGRRP